MTTRPALASLLAGCALLAGSCGHQQPAHHPWPDLPPDAPFLHWPITGSANDHLYRQAVKAWDAATTVETTTIGPHTSVTPLLLDTDTPAGPIAILQGFDARHQPRLAILTGTPTHDAPDTTLTLRTDRPAPAPADASPISLVTAQSQTAANGPVLALALAAPGTTTVNITSNATPAGQSLHANGRAVVGALPATVTAFTTTITTGGVHPSSQYADDRAVGQPHAQPVNCRNRCNADSYEIVLPADALRTALIGGLVTTRHGVVAQITAIRGQTAQVRSITAAGFEAAVTTARGVTAVARTDRLPLHVDDPGHSAISPNDAVFTVQTIDEHTQTRAVLPLGTVTAAPPAPGNTGPGPHWTTETLPVAPFAGGDQDEPLFVMTMQ